MNNHIWKLYVKKLIEIFFSFFYWCIIDLQHYISFKCTTWRGFPGSASSQDPTRQCRTHMRCGFGMHWDDPLEEGMATHSSLLAWRIPWTEEPGGLQSLGSQREGHGWNDLAHVYNIAVQYFYRLYSKVIIKYWLNSLCYRVYSYSLFNLYLVIYTSSSPTSSHCLLYVCVCLCFIILNFS